MSDPISEPKQIVAFERQGEPGVWSTELIDADGGIEQTIFIGARAEERAKSYAALIGESERLTNERDQAQGLLREAAQNLLSTKSAVEIMRSAWRRSAEYALKFATEEPATDEQWRAFGAVEAQMACADELDPEKDAIFEPSELAKARAETEHLRTALTMIRSVLQEHHDWHLRSGAIGLPDGAGGWIEVDNAAAYSECGMCERTIAQLYEPSSRRVRHKTRGMTYTVIGEDFRLHSSRPIEEGATVAVYRGDDGKGWARPLDEFTDGRFEPAEPRS